MTLQFIFLIVSLICFLVAATGKGNMGWLGAAFFILAFLVK